MQHSDQHRVINVVDKLSDVNVMQSQKGAFCKKNKNENDGAGSTNTTSGAVASNLLCLSMDINIH